MAQKVSDEIYKLELYGRGIQETAFCDLLVLDMRNNARTIYLASLMNTEGKIKTLVTNLQEVRSGRVCRAEGDQREGTHRNNMINVYTPEKNFYRVYSNKVDDMTHVLLIAKNAQPNIRERQEWQAEEDRRLAEGAPPRRAPEELVLAWDGDYRSQIYRVLDDRYNTPMLPEWKDYIVDTLINENYYTPLSVFSYGSEYDLEAGILSITERQLEEIISEGLRSMEIDFDPNHSSLMSDGRSDDEGVLKDCTTLDEYLTHFAADLGQRIQENSQLRFDPTKERHHEAFYDLNLHANNQGVTGLFPPQADTVMGAAKTLEKDKYVFFVCEMGTGKTAMGATTPYITEAILSKKRQPDPYRALVFVPSIMVDKWKREISERVPSAKIVEIKSWKDIIPLEKAPYKPTQIEYYVMSSDVAKANYPIMPVENWRMNRTDARAAISEGKRPRAAVMRNEFYSDGELRVVGYIGSTGYYCPRCGQPLKVGKGHNEKMSDEKFFKTRNSSGQLKYERKVENAYCTNLIPVKYASKSSGPRKGGQQMVMCGYNLWQPQRLKRDSLNRKVSPAWYINKRLRRGFFKYLIADEVHEYKSGDTDRANAFGQLVNHTTKQILLTGTLLGGQASDLFYLLARLDSRRLKREGISYDDINLFIERYGVFEHKYRMSDVWGGQSLASSASQTRRKTGRAEKPGVSPQVFSRFLISNCAFLELSDLAQALPRYREEPIFVQMDPMHLEAYRQLESEVGSEMRRSVATGGMKHVSTYINRIYQYADMPFNQGPITYYDDNGNQRVLARPINFDPDYFTPNKYRRLTQLIDSQLDRERKVLVYARFTGTNPVDLYLYDKLKADGYKVGILRSSGSYDGIQFPKQQERERWLKEMMEKYDWDVLITNPRLVSVGLDLLQFPTIVYYQMDYSTYNYMQSSRRSWRIKQTKEVEVYTLVYEDTIQADVLSHIAKKIDAALALQGKFSEEGLRAMADSGDGINALAKRLMNEGHLDSVESVEDRWKRINETREQSMQGTMNFGYEGYDEHIMNPLGLEEVRRIAQSLVAKKQEAFASGKISARELEDYLVHMEDMLLAIEDARQYNKGLRKKDRIIEGQFAFAI